MEAFVWDEDLDFVVVEEVADDDEAVEEDI